MFDTMREAGTRQKPTGASTGAIPVAGPGRVRDLVDSAERVPGLVDTAEPGPVLAAWLSTIDVGAVSGYDRVRVLRAHQRMASHYQAHVLQGMAAVNEPSPRGQRKPRLECGSFVSWFSDDQIAAMVAGNGSGHCEPQPRTSGVPGPAFV